MFQQSRRLSQLDFPPVRTSWNRFWSRLLAAVSRMSTIDSKFCGDGQVGVSLTLGIGTSVLNRFSRIFRERSLTGSVKKLTEKKTWYRASISSNEGATSASYFSPVNVKYLPLFDYRYHRFDLNAFTMSWIGKTCLSGSTVFSTCGMVLTTEDGRKCICDKWIQTVLYHLALGRLPDSVRLETRTWWTVF